MNNKDHQLRNIYALLSSCNPNLIATYQERIPDHYKVAAKLITSVNKNSASICIYSIDDKHYQFRLDLESRNYWSKGNWIWIKQIDINYPEEFLFSITLNPRVIDIPYSNNDICAHWLFRYIAEEVYQTLNTYF